MMEEYNNREIKERLQWLVKLRWIGCIGVFVVTNIVRDMMRLSFPMLPVYLILGFVALYNVYFHIRLRGTEKDLGTDAIKQIGLDFLVLTAAVYFSGGCDSPFLYYYIFHVVISGLLLPRVWTFRFSAFAIALPTLVVGLKHLGVLPHFAVFRDEPEFLTIPIMGAYGGVFASTILLTAYFVTYLADKLFKAQKETRRLYKLSERLRSSIIMDEVIEIISEELSLLTGKTCMIYLHLDKDRMSLYLGPASITENDKRDEPSTKSDRFSIPLADKNIFTESFIAGEPRVLASVAVSSKYEERIIKELMGNARQITILPVMTSFTVGCYEYFHCPNETECLEYGCDDNRCWHITGTFCHGKKMGSMSEKLKECVKCEMFRPVGIFIIDSTLASKSETAIDIDACMRLLDAASLALSNARLYERTLELSETDGLTGIRNRRTFLQVLDMEVTRAERYEKSFGILMLDIDHFKNYNDANGHVQGDVLLTSITQMISYHLRETDIAGRYGGEEFVVLLPETGKDDSITIAERVRQSIEEWEFPKAEGQPEGRITVSIGVASYPEDGPTPEKIILAADDALYSAKETGKNRVIAANRPDMLK